MTDADYVDDLALLANITANAESLLPIFEQTARCIGLSMNADKTEFMRSYLHFKWQTSKIRRLVHTSI